MKLYQINEAIEQIFDNAEIDENGEFIGLDEKLLSLLENQRDSKIENLIAYWKDMAGDIDKFNNEINNLTKRKKSIENKRESLKRFLDYLHAGTKKDYGVHRISYRRSEVLLGNNCNELPENLYETRYETVPKKNEIKKAIKEGRQFKGWELIEKQNIQIK